MTRRERLEAKLEKRAEWAEGRDAKAAASFRRYHAIADNIPMGQPVLVGHHSERRARVAKAEAAGVLVEGTGDYVRVTFPEKPAREVLDALRSAGFRCGGGSWTGRTGADWLRVTRQLVAGGPTELMAYYVLDVPRPHSPSPSHSQRLPARPNRILLLNCSQSGPSNPGRNDVGSQV